MRAFSFQLIGHLVEPGLDTDFVFHGARWNIDSPESVTDREGVTTEAAMHIKVLSVLAVGLLVGSAAPSLAKNAKSMQTPGHKMQRMGSVPGHPGASGYAPGHQMQAKRSKRGYPGASGYAPGRTTGSNSLR